MLELPTSFAPARWDTEVVTRFRGLAPSTPCLQGRTARRRYDPTRSVVDQGNLAQAHLQMSSWMMKRRLRMPQTMCFKGFSPETCEADQASLHAGKHTKDMAQAHKARSLSDVAMAPAAFAAQTSAFTAIRRLWESPEADASPSHTIPERGPMLLKLRSASGLIDGMGAGRTGTI